MSEGEQKKDKIADSRKPAGMRVAHVFLIWLASSIVLYAGLIGIPNNGGGCTSFLAHTRDGWLWFTGMIYLGMSGTLWVVLSASLLRGAELRRVIAAWAGAVLFLLTVTVLTGWLSVHWERERYRRQDCRYWVDDVRRACESFQYFHDRWPWDFADSGHSARETNGQKVFAEMTGKGKSTLTVGKGQSRLFYYFSSRIPEWAVKDEKFVDPWGRDLLFRVDPTTGGAVVWSCGSDGEDDTNDGESPDPKARAKTYYWFGEGDFGDDIVSHSEGQ